MTNASEVSPKCAEGINRRLSSRTSMTDRGAVDIRARLISHRFTILIIQVLTSDALQNASTIAPNLM